MLFNSLLLICDPQTAPCPFPDLLCQLISGPFDFVHIAPVPKPNLLYVPVIGMNILMLIGDVMLIHAYYDPILVIGASLRSLASSIPSFVACLCG